MADKILKGNINLPALKSVYYKKFFSNLQGKNTTEVTVERLILRKIRNLKKEKMAIINPRTDEKLIFKLIPWLLMADAGDVQQPVQPGNHSHEPGGGI